MRWAASFASADTWHITHDRAILGFPLQERKRCPPPVGPVLTDENQEIEGNGLVWRWLKYVQIKCQTNDPKSKFNFMVLI